MDREIDRVVPLDELRDYEVARGEPDVRGWDVIAGDGTRIGEVDELLVDTAAKKVRFLDVTVDEELVHDPDVTQRVIIPIGSARLQEDEDQVFVDGLTSTEIFHADEVRQEERPSVDSTEEPAVLVPRERAIVELDPPPDQS
ncbi:MAG: PRC-barrel domain-containing protein [Gemmatimonadetes bacterium]|nr:PRC-barrel domain-containing protein [Gemmatimonadota bacterium]